MIISVIKAQCLYNKVCLVFLSYIIAKEDKKLLPNDVKVVHKYLKVFLNELSRLPPQHDEFNIELVHGPQLISKALNRTKLVELNK